MTTLPELSREPIETGIVTGEPPTDAWTQEMRRGYIAAKRTAARIPLEKLGHMMLQYGGQAPTNDRDPFLFGYRLYWFAKRTGLGEAA